MCLVSLHKDYTLPSHVISPTLLIHVRRVFHAFWPL